MSLSTPPVRHPPALFSWKMIVLFVVTLTVIVGVCLFFFLHSRDVVDRLVKDRLRNEAAIAALFFSGEELDQIRQPEDTASAQFGELVWRLNDIRTRTPQIRFAYIMRQTADPMVLEFVIDADALNTPEQLDDDGDGIVEESEVAALPGEPYDISDIPVLQGPAFLQPMTDDEMTHDQWGYTLSGYAPIRYSDGRTAAIIGIDMTAEDYVAIRQSIFSIQSLFLILLGGFLVILGTLGVIWRNRVRNMQHLDDERRWLLQLILHQVGTPLTIFKWGVESLQDMLLHLPESARAEVNEHILILEDGISRLNHVAEVLLAADRIQEGSMQVAEERVSLKSVIDKTVADVQSRLALRAQQITVDMPQDALLRLDGRLLSGVLREILDNAMLYSPQNGVIRIQVRRHNRHVEVQVSDQGTGIPVADLPRIFERFSRGSNAGKYDPNGTGVGLYISKGIIERFGGKIAVDSAEGKGTMITFSLPVTE